MKDGERGGMSDGYTERYPRRYLKIYYSIYRPFDESSFGNRPIDDLEYFYLGL